MSEDFDWREDRDCIAVGEQFAIAIYPNPNGDIVIRQEDRWGDEDDIVIVSKSNVRAVCMALMEAAGIEDEPAITLLPAPKSPGAERSRRYRQRHAQRDGVTPRDGESVTHNGRADGELFGVAAE